ncbi:thioredoxin-like protein [Hypoxylon crocopeplum]|nr:thioredoxin-like protein [Hypoxylon crocopeplum]
MATVLRKLFRRKKQPPLVCSVKLNMDDDHHHQHTAACFMDFEPLAIVELFQSQGCQACPPAIPGILEGANNPNLQLLSFNVTLFDHLGWKDTLAAPQWDSRQRAYLRRWARNSLFTPMVVANGVADGSGAGGKEAVGEIISRARNTAKSMDWHIYVDANDTDVRIDSDKDQIESHDILVVVFDAKSEKIKVAKGPNKGKKMEHRNVVKDIMKIGEWVGGTIVVPLPMARSAMQPELGAVVIVQAPQGGAIVGAAKL